MAAILGYRPHDFADCSVFSDFRGIFDYGAFFDCVDFDGCGLLFRVASIHDWCNGTGH
jgi:hypothetical protein